MKIVNMVCPNCGASLQVDVEQKHLACNYCGNSLLVDDGVQHVRYDNAEEAGYQFEKGRQRARAEAGGYQASYGNPGQPPKKRRTWLWVLGWIFMFPVPLTILVVRSRKMEMTIKIAIIVIAWIVYLAIGYLNKDTDAASDNSGNATIEESSEAAADDAFLINIRLARERGIRCL